MAKDPHRWNIGDERKERYGDDSAGVHKWHYQPDRDLANISHDIDNYQRVNHYDEDIDWWEGHPDDRDYRNSWDEASERDYGDRRFGF